MSEISRPRKSENLTENVAGLVDAGIDGIHCVLPHGGEPDVRSHLIKRLARDGVRHEIALGISKSAPERT